MSDADIDANPHLQKALKKIRFGAKPIEIADAYAELLEFRGLHEWAAKFREARIDGDRVMQVMDEFHEWSKKARAVGNS